MVSKSVCELWDGVYHIAWSLSAGKEQLRRRTPGSLRRLEACKCSGSRRNPGTQRGQGYQQSCRGALLLLGTETRQLRPCSKLSAIIAPLTPYPEKAQNKGHLPGSGRCVWRWDLYSLHSPEGRRIECPRARLFPSHFMAVGLVRYVTSPKYHPSLSLFKMNITISASAVSLWNNSPQRCCCMCRSLRPLSARISRNKQFPLAVPFSFQTVCTLQLQFPGRAHTVVRISLRNQYCCCTFVRHELGLHTFPQALRDKMKMKWKFARGKNN